MPGPISLGSAVVSTPGPVRNALIGSLRFGADFVGSGMLIIVLLLLSGVGAAVVAAACEEAGGLGVDLDFCFVFVLCFFLPSVEEAEASVYYTSF